MIRSPALLIPLVCPSPCLLVFPASRRILYVGRIEPCLNNLKVLVGNVIVF
jgi:hypothetical protein